MPVTGMGPIVTALDDLPAVPLDGVVLANELLDNLPFRVVERRDGTWWEVRVAVDGEALVESVVPATSELAAEADLVVTDPPDGARVPVPTALAGWLRDVRGRAATRSAGGRRLRGDRRRAHRAGRNRVVAHLP